MSLGGRSDFGSSALFFTEGIKQGWTEMVRIKAEEAELSFVIQNLKSKMA
jgi:hypothetical protein